MNKNDIFSRLAAYLLGLCCLALGTVLSVRAGLGVTCAAALGYVLTLGTPLSMGTWTVVLFALYILAQLALAPARGQRLRVLGQLPFSLLLGGVTDTCLALTGGMRAPGPMGAAFLLVFSVFLTAAGVVCCVRADFLLTAPDGLVLALSHRFGRKLEHVKSGFDLASVGLALAAGPLLTGRVQGVGPGTVLSALLVGPLVGLLQRLFARRRRQRPL